jgi:hypothetical protein
MVPISYTTETRVGNVVTRVTLSADGKFKTVNKYKEVFGVISKQNVTMTSFDTEPEAVEFRDNGFFGYYKDCTVEPIHIYAN